MASLRFLVANKRIKLYGFVIMPNHIHLVWQNRALQKVAEHGSKIWIKPLFRLFLKKRKIFVAENFAKKKKKV